MEPSFAETLARGAALLRELPRGRDDLARARWRAEQFRAEHPGLRAELLADRRAGSASVDYDLLLEDPGGGVLVLSWRPDSGLPWVIEFAEDPAAREVVRVNAERVTIQEALLFLQLAGNGPGLMDRIVSEVIIGEALAADPPEVSEEEAQAAADRFRRENGLRSATATARWLEETGLSEARFTDLAYGMAQRE
jgi:putative peptide maturation system protein